MAKQDVTKLVERLERIFPNVEMIINDEFTDENGFDFAPSTEIDWYYIIEKLNENGLGINCNACGLNER